MMHDYTLSFFLKKVNVTNLLGLSKFQKCTTTIHIMAYIVKTNATHEYYKILESTTMET